MSEKLTDIADALPKILAAMKEHGATRLQVGDLTVQMGDAQAAAAAAFQDAFYGPNRDKTVNLETMRDPELYPDGVVPTLPREDDGQAAS